MKNLLKYLIAIGLLTVNLNGYAQTMDISLFKGKSEKLKKSVREINRIKKEHINTYKQRKKEYKNFKEDLNNEALDSLEIDVDSARYIQSLQKQVYMHTGEFYTIEEISKWDPSEEETKLQLIAESENRLRSHSSFNRYAGYQDLYKERKAQLRTYSDSLKNVEGLSDFEKDYLIDKRKEEIQNEVQTELEGRASALLSDPDFLIPESPADQFTEGSELANSVLKQGAPEDLTNKAKTAGKDYFKDQQEALSKAMDQTKSLKKKYSKVPNAKDLSTATKRNSLKGKPLSERLIFGGNFQVHIDEQSAVDLNPELAYNINKNFSLGLGGTYQVNTSTNEFFDNLKNTQVIGYRVFVENKLFKSFYLHIELERLNKSPDPNGNIRSGWYAGLLAGLERRMKVRPGLEGQVSLLYNFLYKSNPLYDSPWTLRFGFNFVPSKKPGVKKKVKR